MQVLPIIFLLVYNYFLFVQGNPGSEGKVYSEEIKCVNLEITPVFLGERGLKGEMV